MRQPFSLFIFLLLLWFILTSSGGKPKPPWEKENVSFPMMNQEIRHTMQENERQKDMHEKQVGNSVSENMNQKQWTKFKEVKATVQDRLRIISFAMQAIPTGNNIFHETEMIVNTQKRIYSEIQDAPLALLTALPAQISFVNDLQMVTRYILGIIASYGAINQMEKADRKILLDYALSEVERLNNTSTYVLMLVRQAKEKMNMKKALFQYYKNRDQQIVKDILGKLKHF